MKLKKKTKKCFCWSFGSADDRNFRTRTHYPMSQEKLREITQL